MRYDCDASGCFNKVKRPKIEVFANCFGRGINFGDVDMIVERNGYLLIGEWKPGLGAVGRGQAMLHDALVAIPGISLIVIVGDAQTMIVTHFTVRFGSHTEQVDGDLTDLQTRIAKWYRWADAQPVAVRIIRRRPPRAA